MRLFPHLILLSIPALRAESDTDQQALYCFGILAILGQFTYWKNHPYFIVGFWVVHGEQTDFNPGPIGWVDEWQGDEVIWSGQEQPLPIQVCQELRMWWYEKSAGSEGWSCVREGGGGGGWGKEKVLISHVLVASWEGTTTLTTVSPDLHLQREPK